MAKKGYVRNNAQKTMLVYGNNVPRVCDEISYNSTALFLYKSMYSVCTTVICQQLQCFIY